MKETAIEFCTKWKNAGQPKSGVIHAQYKKTNYCTRSAPEKSRLPRPVILHEALLRKSNQEFWKIWKSKFPSASADIVHVDGIADCAINATNFARHFESTCNSFRTIRNEALKAQYNAFRSQYCGSTLTDKWCRWHQL